MNLPSDTDFRFGTTREQLYFGAHRYVAQAFVAVEFEGRLLLGTGYGSDRVLQDVVMPGDAGNWLRHRWQESLALHQARLREPPRPSALALDLGHAEILPGITL